ncbi:dihydrolipoyl dehydrogenase [Spirochaetia bacterium 38H-sp]|uniref:Dihydrolipoyl dehydrogenase n=1 Tax=Rarispira pelagica TaxID=3141764 RepID=A0ABU9UBR9_9SPIR
MSYMYDVLVIGAGPGGYVAAIRASQLGLKAAVVEKDKVGGVCLNKGCIPSKALIHMAGLYGSAVSELSSIGVSVDTSGFDYKKVFDYSRKVAMRLNKGVEYLLKKNKVDVITGSAVFSDAHTVDVDGKSYTADKIIIATGSSPVLIPGFEPDGKKVFSSDDAIMSDSLPETMLILGAGAIGMEFAYIMSSFGVKVTVVEMLDRVLPFTDSEVSAHVVKELGKRGVEFMTSTRALSLDCSGEGVVLSVESSEGKKELSAERLLVSVGRRPNTSGLGLDKIGVELDEKGFVRVGDYYKTSCDSVYAIGDVISSPLLAHVASKEGEIAVSHIAGKAHEKLLAADEIPYAVYCEPQVAGFGLTTDEAKRQGISASSVVFPFRGVGKAVAISDVEGFVKLVFDDDTSEILGAHIVGPDATELVHELLLAKKSELLLSDVAEMVHAHPTLSEAVMEAARMAEGWAIHF